MKKTVIQVFREVVKNHARTTALKEKKNGQWESTTWEEYSDQVHLIARAFIKLGLQPGKGVAIIGYNCREWFYADVGAIFAGGIPAGIYTTNSPEQCQYIAHHCEAQIAVVENADQLAKFDAIRDQLPHLKAIILINGTDPADDVYSWSDLTRLAKDVSDADLEARISSQTADDICTLIYTSGTTGDPKAVMISHHNATWTAVAAANSVEMRSGDTSISYLPLSHVAEQMVSIHGPMVTGGTVGFAESLEKLGDNLREIRPNYFLGVPRVWEKIQAKMQAAGAQNSPLKKKIAAWARGVGLAAGYADQEGGRRPLSYPLAHKLVFSKVRAKLGFDRCRIMVTSAAPISKDTLEFFLSLDIPLMEIYGMSECTGPASISTADRYRTGKAGYAMPGTELKIAEDGEVCMRGPHIFKGYMKDETATAEALDSEGWLHSGDIGTIDADGFLQITDRKKELIITAGGENIAPQVIEAELKAIPIIAQAVVIGDRRKYLSALFTLDSERLATECKAAKSSAKDPSAAQECQNFRDHLQSQIERVNAKLARVQTIKKWTILPSEFTPESGELTPTMKLKRRVVNERYSPQIEAMYE
jgi:long-subunit acyl-CoA synthetase (AMP-forming)